MMTKEELIAKMHCTEADLIGLAKYLQEGGHREKHSGKKGKMLFASEVISALVNDAPKTPPITAGTVEKGGVNRHPSQTTARPPAPTPTRPAHSNAFLPRLEREIASVRPIPKLGDDDSIHLTEKQEGYLEALREVKSWIVGHK